MGWGIGHFSLNYISLTLNVGGGVVCQNVQRLFREPTIVRTPPTRAQQKINGSTKQPGQAEVPWLAVKLIAS